MNETIVKTEKITELKNLVSEIEKLQKEYFKNTLQVSKRESKIQDLLKLIKTL